MVGKLPPQDIEVEEAVIGALLLEGNNIDIAAIIPTDEYFYNSVNQEIAKSILNLHHDKTKIDILTVANDLNARGKLEEIGGAYTLAKITNNVISSAHLIAHVRIIKDKYIRRELIRLAAEIAKNAYEEENECHSIIEDVNLSINKISAQNVTVDVVPLAEGLRDTISMMEEEKKKIEDIPGLTSGLTKVDEVFGGWRAPDLIIIAARPSVGKTALALNYAYHASAHKPVVVFSYEMSIDQLIRRLISIDTKVPYSEVRTPSQMSEDNWERVMRCPGLDKRKIFLNDNRNVNTFQMQAICRRLIKDHGLGLIIIDYLQLMPEERHAGNREQQIAKISRELKGMAKDLNVPVIALSQLSRDVEKGGVIRAPRLSDLRESGAIEQDADIVKFIYNPLPQDLKDNPMLKHALLCNVAKHRGGALDVITLYKDLSIQTIYDDIPSVTYYKDDQIVEDVNHEVIDFTEDDDDLPF